MNLLRVEFHCHTIISKDSLLLPSALLAACRRKGIDRVVITDHNSTRGARQAQALDPDRVIIGEEIMTTQGEILAAFVQEEIPAGLSAEDTITRLQEQDAFISISHPFDILRKGHWQMPALKQILPYIDAVETFNSRCLSAEFNQQAREFAQNHNIPGTVGSDAHTASELGRATLLLTDFHDAASLRRALPSARADLKLSPFWVHFFSRYAVFYKKLGFHRHHLPTIS